jgi:hypothetical protein
MAAEDDSDIPGETLFSLCNVFPYEHDLTVSASKEYEQISLIIKVITF